MEIIESLRSCVPRTEPDFSGSVTNIYNNLPGEPFAHSVKALLTLDRYY